MADEIIDVAYDEQKPDSIGPVGGSWGHLVPPKVGYHPVRFRMRIETIKQDIVLVCDYDPTEFTEQHNMAWETTPITGRGTDPVQFKTISPREWSMKLLFNTLGDNQATRNSAQEKFVSDALAKLKRMSYPSNFQGNTVTSDSGGALRPPTLKVFLTTDHLSCVITKMSTTIKAIHPTQRYPTRAEVDITFTEFVEFSY